MSEEVGTETIGGTASHKKLVLIFDVGGTACSELARRIEEQVGVELEVMSLRDPRVTEWRRRALGEDPPWCPTLIEVKGERVRAWTGWRLRVNLSRFLGPVVTRRVMRALGEAGARAEAMPVAKTVPGLTRGQFLKGAGGAALGMSVLSGCALFPSAVEAQSSGSLSGQPEAKRIGRTRDKAVSNIRREMKRQEKNGLNGVLRIRWKDEVLVHEAYGWRDREARIPMTLDTGFDIGSIVKPITGATVLKLEEQGRLSTSDTLDRFFPSVPADKRGITVWQVGTHTAGLPLYLGDDYELVDRDQALERIFEKPLRFPPGSKEAYSNAGYSLLAMTIEEVAGMPYEQAVREAVLEPAGTTEIGYVLPGWTKEDLAVGYRSFRRPRGRWGTPLDKPWLEDGPSWTLRGNGGMLATAEQLAKWFDAVYAGDVLGPDALDAFYKGGGGESKKDGLIVGQAGGNGVFNTLQESWVDRDVHFTIFTSTPSPTNAEKVFEEISDDADTLVRLAARSGR